MPTYDPLPRFWADYEDLTEDQQKLFREAVELFKEGLETGKFHPKLRVHRIHGTRDVWSMTWDTDGDSRATFQYGRSIHPGEPHIIWRRVGSHDIYRRP